ncbi:MAG: hypothetical protein ACI4V7_12090 [Succinivibrionaceae bacterium]
MKSYVDLQNKIKSMTMREKFLICLVGCTFFICPGYFSFIEPNFKVIDSKKTENKELSLSILSKQDELSVLSSRLTTDPNLMMRNEIAKLESEIEKLDEKYKKEAMDLIDSTIMVEVLAKFLDTDSSIKVKSLQSIQPKLLLKKHDVSLYQHGVRIHLVGKYLDILSYLTTLEQMKYRFYWDKLNYTVSEYPYADVEIELYTLSINKDFIRG